MVDGDILSQVPAPDITRARTWKKRGFLLVRAASLHGNFM
jgi:hypothetical protein